MIKAIETVYNGYRFRSRLEARWAVFFDTLGIEYRYEYDSFDLDGTWYLPDFWLPELDCWVEIKGQEPTHDEYVKACLLSLHANKVVCIFPGDINFPDTRDDIPNKDGKYLSYYEKNAYCYDPSELTIAGDDTHSECFSLLECWHGFDNCPNHQQFPPNELARILFRTEMLGRYADSTKLRIINAKLEYLVPTYGDSEKRQFTGRISVPLPNLIKRHEKDFIELLSCKPDMWEWGVANFWGVSGNRGYFWGECPSCHSIGIGSAYQDFRIFDRFKNGEYDHSHYHLAFSPRLHAAYTAARQARFERGQQS